MWFKQLTLFQLTDSITYSRESLTDKLSSLCFQECLPSMPYSSGWVSPVDEDDAPLVQAINGYLMICLQIEEKILPPIVVRQELAKKVKLIETMENRKVGAKEKYNLKEELTITLLPRAFSKLTKVFAYIDTRHRRLMLATNNPKKTEQFLLAFKKTCSSHIEPLAIDKLSKLMTSWITHQQPSSAFSIEKSCLLQDSNHQHRVIRCKEQDLFAASIQSLIKDGCELKQVALNWQDRVDFVLSDKCSLQGISFNDEIIAQSAEMEAGTKQQQFNVDFFIMTETFEHLFKDLFELLTPVANTKELAA
jgi:recombination associated protein RdgC